MSVASSRLRARLLRLTAVVGLPVAIAPLAFGQPLKLSNEGAEPGQGFVLDAPANAPEPRPAEAAPQPALTVMPAPAPRRATPARPASFGLDAPANADAGRLPLPPAVEDFGPVVADGPAVGGAFVPPASARVRAGDRPWDQQWLAIPEDARRSTPWAVPTFIWGLDDVPPAGRVTTLAPALPAYPVPGPGYAAPGYGVPAYGVPAYGVPGNGVPSYPGPALSYGPAVASPAVLPLVGGAGARLAMPECVRIVKHKTLLRTGDPSLDPRCVVILVDDPCDPRDEPLAIPMTIPGSACEEPAIEGGKCLLGLGNVWFRWECGFRIKVVFHKDGEVVAHVYGR